MRLFLEVTKRSFQRHLTYRAATLAGLLTNFFFGILRAAVFIALYGSRDQVAGISLEGVVTYAALTQAVIAYLSIFHWSDLANSVYTGDIATDLLKPMGYFRFWMARDLGRALVSFLLRGVVIMAAYALVFDLVWPQSWLQWSTVALSMILSWWLSFAWRFLINLTAFWTPNAEGILRFFFVSAWFLSGFLMPLRYFPEWVQRISAWTPFPAMINTVIEVYLGILQGGELAAALLAQAAWIIVITLAGQIVLRAGVRRLVILGG
jgi:ABC-2 type transport system permease protein